MSGDTSAGLSRETLLARLNKIEAALLDLEEERRFTLGQTGVHIGAARVDYLRRSWASEEGRLRAEMDEINRALSGVEATPDV
jgi:hypothetical protein